jgi:transcriptional regulator with XRE-family HTH domain
MQGNIAELIRELMELQQISIRKVSARIAEQHEGSIHGYTQQVSRILNDPSYDPSLSTVQKILSALNVSLWQVSKAPQPKELPVPQTIASQTVASQTAADLQQVSDRLDQLSTDVVAIKLSLSDLQQSITALTQLSANIADAVLLRAIATDRTP